LENDSQVLELKVQDIILPASKEALDETSLEVLFRVANFIDDLLVEFYKLPSYYNLKKKEDLAGQLILALAPHISSGMVGRIIGFSKTQGMFAHPLFHAALRRDCDGDEASVSLLLDCFLNFSSNFLPNTRGAKTMDAPLVLTSLLNPSEVDDQALGVDTLWEYPLELYEAALEYKPTGDVNIEQIRKRIGTEKQYEGIGFTHDTSDINLGVTCSAYKALPSMEEKLNGQMEIARLINAVDEADVARLVIEKHFLKDTKGNLRKFSQQAFKCVKCTVSFRRPPLTGKCPKCSGKLLFTVTEGSVTKYLDSSIKLANDFAVSPYLKQTLDLLKKRIESVFGKEAEIQEGLGKWVN
jgi:DNA polymerase II large subunit